MAERDANLLVNRQSGHCRIAADGQENGTQEFFGEAV